METTFTMFDVFENTTKTDPEVWTFIVVASQSGASTWETFSLGSPKSSTSRKCCMRSWTKLLLMILDSEPLGWRFWLKVTWCFTLVRAHISRMSCRAIFCRSWLITSTAEDMIMFSWLSRCTPCHSQMFELHDFICAAAGILFPPTSPLISRTVTSENN